MPTMDSQGLCQHVFHACFPCHVARWQWQWQMPPCLSWKNVSWRKPSDRMRRWRWLEKLPCSRCNQVDPAGNRGDLTWRNMIEPSRKRGTPLINDACLMVTMVDEFWNWEFWQPPSKMVESWWIKQVPLVDGWWFFWMTILNAPVLLTFFSSMAGWGGETCCLTSWGRARITATCFPHEMEL